MMINVNLSEGCDSHALKHHILVTDLTFFQYFSALVEFWLQFSYQSNRFLQNQYTVYLNLMLLNLLFEIWATFVIVIG